ncbi:pyridoxal phosphate-dependent decarboxylase family protein [Pendulispora albinea]|uniref:Aminotransferase class I/II-fold pyridoxal phosphate-dependent enzyme n=1 Tax=Pendulispora albinea TaxID=2741071 RepID=A0ABZ2LV22_9BACT
MTPDQFRALGYKLIDWIADYRETVEERRVMSNEAPGAVRAKLPPSPPEEPESFDAILADFERIVVPGVTHWNHPRFFAYFPSNTTLSAVLGDLLASGLGAQCMSWQTSPAGTELEEVVMDWLRQMLGLPDLFRGAIQDTSSGATLVAMLCARERSTKDARLAGGLQSCPAPLVVYVSDQAHSSVDKAIALAGIGRDQVRTIETDERYAIRVDRLRARLEEDVRAGNKPCAIVATIGTTATTAVDPLEPLRELAQRYGAWLHVDAAMAGIAMIAPECRAHWSGIEGVDSITVDPHKWLGTGMHCTAYYVRDPAYLTRVMSTQPSYLRTAADDKVTNFRDWGIPLGRRFRALKLWCLLREQGTSGLLGRIRRDLANAQWLSAQVANEPGWEVVAPVLFQTVCVRHVPEGLRTDAEIDAHNQSWADRINEDGRAYLTSTVVNGRRIVRVSIGAEPTELEHVAQLWDSMRATVARRP